MVSAEASSRSIARSRMRSSTTAISTELTRSVQNKMRCPREITVAASSRAAIARSPPPTPPRSGPGMQGRRARSRAL